MALGAGELLAGLVPGVPSPVASVGSVVIDVTPGVVERFAIAMFGLADKLVLNLGIVVVALFVGAGAGLVARRRMAAAVAVFMVFAAAGFSAGLAATDTVPVLLALALTVAVVAGVTVLRRLLAAAPGPVASVESAPGEPHAVASPDRRRFLRLAVGATAVAVVSAAAGRMLLQRSVPTAAAPLPAPVEPVTAPPPAASFSTEGLTPLIVEHPNFYRIDTRLTVPRVDAGEWQLRIHGMVDRELELTYDELLGMPLIERYVTIACVSNEVGGGLVGNAAWSGVRLETLLDRAGVHPDAGQIVGRAVDDWTAGFPTEVAFDGRDAMVAVGMNGQPLPPVHGFPARLIVPGLYGYVSATKWLTEIELATWDGFNAYWVPRGWAKEAPVKTQSRIDVPRGTVAAGDVDVAGVAWAPHRGIARVEISVDDGPWEDADLSEPLSDDAWRQWRYTWAARPGRHRLRVRATDGDGQTQTPDLQPPFPDGATGYHTVEVSVRPEAEAAERGRGISPGDATR